VIRVLLDVNIVLDVLANREPFAEDAAAVLQLVEAGVIDGLLSAHTVTTLHYLLSRHLGKARAKKVLGDLLQLVGVVAVDENRIRHALAMNWTDEAVEIVASRPKFAARELTTKKLAGLCYVTDELLQDSPALGIALERLIALEAGFRIEDSIINGTGAGRPLGILNANALITVAAESGQAGSTVQAANIINMWSRLWVGAKPNAVWLVNTDIFPQLLGMTWSAGTATVPLFAWSADGVPLLLGRPVVETEHSAVLGTVGDIILCDLGEIMLGERTGGLRTDLSLHVRFANHENAFRFIWRTDAQPKWSSATTPKNGSSTVSPYIALATRP